MANPLTCDHNVVVALYRDSHEQIACVSCEIEIDMTVWNEHRYIFDAISKLFVHNGDKVGYTVPRMRF